MANNTSGTKQISVPHTIGAGVPCIPKPMHGPAGKKNGTVPSTDSCKETTSQNKRLPVKRDKPRVSTAVHSKTKPAQQDADKKKSKRRCRKRDPAEQPSQPWTEDEIAQFRALVKAEGATAWKDKSVKLARLCGNVRTPKALHTRYLREIGRIVDRPRCVYAVSA